MTSSGGYIGIGTSSPGSLLHLYGGIFSVEKSGNAIIRLISPDTATILDMINEGGDADEKRWQIVNVGGELQFRLLNDDESVKYYALRLLHDGDTYMQGNLGIGTSIPAYKLDVEGDINVSGAYYNSGTPVADFVFDPGYLIHSIEYHAGSMWENGHLPMVAGEDELGDQPYSMSERREQTLAELEIAHIYIHRLNQTIAELEERILELEK